MRKTSPGRNHTLATSCLQTPASKPLGNGPNGCGNPGLHLPSPLMQSSTRDSIKAQPTLVEFCTLDRAFVVRWWLRVTDMLHRATEVLLSSDNQEAAENRNMASHESSRGTIVVGREARWEIGWRMQHSIGYQKA